MEEKDKLRSFYDNVSSYLDIGSYDDFYGAMQDPSRRQKFFDSTSQYVDIGDSDKFNQFVGDYFGQQQAASRVDVSDVETQQQPQVPQMGAGDVAIEGDGRFKPSWGFERSQKMQDKMPEPKPAVKMVNEKTEYDFSPENVQGMREFAEGAYVKAFDEVNALMPEIERSIRERALFDTEQNNRNKDASREAIEYHANKEADRRIKQFREKMEKEGTAGFSGESLASYLAFDDEELRDKIASAYNDKDAVDKYMQAYYQSTEGKAERTREADNAKVMVDELKGKRSQGFWNTVGGMFGDMAISASMAEGGMSYQDQQQLSKIQDGIRRTNSVNMAINQSLHEAENTLNVAIKNIEEGKGNAFVQLGRGVRYANLDNVIPMSDLYGQMGVLQLYEKLDEDGKPKEPLTQDEQTLYESLALNKYVGDKFGGYQTMLNRIGSGLPEQAMFTLSFLLSSEFAGAQTIGRGATNVLRRGIGNVVNKEIKSGIGRFMLDKALPTAFGMGAETLYRTGLQVPAIMSGGIERHVGTIKVNPDTGEVGGFENGVDWDEALWKSTLNVANETGTELVGDRIIEPGLGWFGRNTAAGKRIADFRKYIGEIGDGTVDDILKMGDDISHKAGWSKWYIEVGEEEVGAFNNAAFIHDQTWEEAFSRKALMETTLNCMIFGVAMGTSTTTAQAMRNMPSTVTTRNEKRKASRIIDKMDGISTDEIDEHINNDSSNELADWLVDKSAQGNSNGDWTDSQRAAVANYVRTSVAQKAERHYKDMQLQNEVKAMEERVDDMTNNQSGDVIEANFKIDGQMQTGTIVGGRVSVVENDVIDNEGNPKQAFIYNPNLSSVTLIVRVENPDGTVTKKQVSARDIESINSVAEAEQYKGERRSELEMDMQRSVVDMYTTPTASAIWGTDLQAGVVLPYNDMLLRLDGKDENGQWILTRVDEEGTPIKKTNPFVLSDSEFRIMGMTERLRAMQQQGAPQEDIDDAIDDINTEQDLQNIDQSDDENNIWDNIAGFMKGYTQTNEEGDFIPEASRPEAAAGYLVALQKGDIGKTIAIVNERIAELEARLASKPAEVQNNGEGVVAMAGNESMAEDAYIETQKQIVFLSNIMDGLIAKQEQQNEIEEVKFANTPVSQMEVGQQFPVEWRGQQAMATVMGKDADGRSVVTVRDMDGEDIEAGIDDMSDADWEGVRVQPQEATAPEQVPPQAAPQAPEQVEPQQQEEVPQAAPQQETPQQHPLDDFIAKHGENAENKLGVTVDAINKEITGLEKDLDKAEKDLANMPEPYDEKTQKAQGKQEEKIAKLRADLDEKRNILAPYAAMQEELDRRKEVRQGRENGVTDALTKFTERLNNMLHPKRESQESENDFRNIYEFIARKMSRKGIGRTSVKTYNKKTGKTTNGWRYVRPVDSFDIDSFKAETGWKDSEIEGFKDPIQPFFVKEGGKTFGEFVHSVWESAKEEGIIPENSSDADVRDAVIAFLQEVQSVKDINDYIEKHRRDEQAEQEAIANDMIAQHNGYESGEAMENDLIAQASARADELLGSDTLSDEDVAAFDAELSQRLDNLVPSIEETAEETEHATQETTVESTEDEDFIQPTDEEAPFSVTGIGKEYQDKLGEIQDKIRKAAKNLQLRRLVVLNKQKAQLLQEYLDKIKTDDVTVLDEDTYIEVLRANGVSESSVAIIQAKHEETMRKNQLMGGFYVRGKIFVFANDILSIEHARRTYIHERQHSITAKDVSLLREVVAETSRDELAGYVRALSESDSYDNESHNVLADEFISMAMEEAYSTDDVEAALRAKGVNNEQLINTIKSLDNEQQTSDGLAKARRGGGRNLHVDNNAERGSGHDGQNQGRRPGEVEEQGLRPSYRGNEKTGNLDNEQRTDESLAKARRTSPVNESRQGDNGQNGGNQKRESRKVGGQRPGTVQRGEQTAERREVSGILPIDKQTPKNTTIDEVLYSIKVNHNSPYLLKKADGSFVDPKTGEKLGFDHRFMSNGEGNQAHGYGSYFSVNDLRTYGGQLGGNNVKYKGKDYYDSGLQPIALVELQLNDGNVEAARKELESRIEEAENLGEPYVGTWMLDNVPIKNAKIALEQLSNPKDFEFDRHHYEVEIPDNDGTNYIEEGEKLSKPLQDKVSQAIQLIQREKAESIEEYNPTDEEIEQFGDNAAEQMTGKTAYDYLTRELGDIKQASEALSLQGIVGIHYDGRQDGECYVIFDENDAKIVDHVRFSVNNSDIRFSTNGTHVISNGKSLVGIHNIGAEKLRKAMKNGGFANPSAAVIDIDKQEHKGYGDVSLIMPSSLVDSRTGRNAGTYAGDAYTPEYPNVSYREGKNTDKLVKDLVKDLPKELGWAIRQGIGEYMGGNRSRSGLEYLFLKEKGQEMPIVKNERRYPDISTEQIDKRLGVEESANRGHSGELYAAYEKLDGDDLVDFNMWFEAYGDEEKIKQRKDLMERNARVKEMLEEQLGEHMGYGKFDTTWYNILRDERDAGNENIGRTLEDAAMKIDELGLRSEFEDWKQKTIDGLGYEEVIFDGFTPSGYRRYVPNTVENASRIMNKKEKTNWLSDAGTHATKAMLLDKFNTLNDIRKNRGLLESDQEVINQAYEEASDAWSELGSELSDMQKIDDNRFINHDIALNRLQEAMMQRNPAAYLNKEYKYNLDDEFNDRIKEVKQQIKSLPSKYFETKFRRPVYLNEFAAAVVPNDLPQDLKERLQQSGLPLFEYDPNKEGDRRAVTLEATEGDGIRFSVANRNQAIFVSNAARAVEGIKQEKATPEQWLKMIEKNGGLKAGEDKWLGLSQWLKDQANTDTPRSDESLTEWAERNRKKTLTKQEVLDFINENAIKIEETHYEEGSDWRVNEKMQAFNEEFLDLVSEGDEETGSIYVSDHADWAYEAMVERYGDDFRQAFEWEYDRNNYPHLVPTLEYQTDTPTDAARYFLDIDESPINDTRLEYTTEGLDNKREIALTVPTIEPWNESDEIHFGDAGEGRAVAWIRFGETTTDGLEIFHQQILDKYGPTYMMDLNEEEQKQYDELRKKHKERVLVIDEIQSKRHQEGREKGYLDNEETKRLYQIYDDLQKKEYEILQRQRAVFDEIASSDEAKPLIGEDGLIKPEAEKEYDNLVNQNAELKELNRQWRENEQAKQEAYTRWQNAYDAIPSAPFEKNWMELAMKRMLRLAAEEGYDKVAWTTGEQQAERYNIGNVVENINSKPNDDGYTVDIVLKNGGSDIMLDTDKNGVITDGYGNTEYEGKNLSDVVGKEIATRLMTDDIVQLDGDNLRIGGEGMKGFYDKMIPSFMNKYGKQWGVKVGEVTMPNLEEGYQTMHSIDVNEQMKADVMEGQVMFSVKNSQKDADDNQLSLFLQNNTGEYETQDGQTIGFTSLLGAATEADAVRGRDNVQRGDDILSYHLRRLEPGETCHVERRYQKSKMFDFTGSEKIESADDVAYIFNKLEDAAVENSFIVLVKDGKPTIIHTGVGSYGSTYVSVANAIVAYKNINPDEVWFVHNHPSGSITSSQPDRDSSKKFEKVFGKKYKGGIIIDTTSGKYGVFDSKSDTESGSTHNAQKNETDIDVYEFSKQVFDKDWNPETAFRARTHQDIATFVSSHRLGEHDKMSLLVLNNNLNVVGNVFLPYESIGEADIKKLTDDVLYYTNQMAGTQAVIYGSFTADDVRDIKKLANNIANAEGRLVDVISTNSDYTGLRSVRMMGAIKEDVQEIKEDEARFSVNGQQRIAVADEFNRRTGANMENVSDYVRVKESLIRDWFDGLHPLEQAQKLIEEKLGRKLRDSEKAYELATQTTSVSAAMIEEEEKKHIIPILNKATELIRKMMNNDRLSREEAYRRLSNYMLAKHGLERNKWFHDQALQSDPNAEEEDMSGLTGLAESLGENPDDYKAVAERIVKEFEDEYDSQEIDDYWDEMRGFTNRLLEISYESGMIDKDTYEGLKKRHKFYVPLRGFGEETAGDMFDYIAQMPHFQDVLKKAKGRKSMASDPLSNLYNMLQSAIVIGNQNKVMQKLYNLAVNAKSDLLRTKYTWYVYNDVTDTWEEKHPDIPKDATADEIDAIVKQFDSDMQQAKANGKAKRNLNKLDLGKKVLPYQAKEHEMVAYIDGKKVILQVVGNPVLAQALNKANQQQLGIFAETMQGITRFMSMINTSLSPAFMLTNSARDIGFALFSAMVTGGFKKTGQMAAWMATSGWVIPRLMTTGKLDAGLVKALGKQNAAQIEQWWNEFTQNGGETGFTRTLSAEKARGQVDDMIRHMLNGSKDGESRLRKSTVGLVESAGRWSEDISRFAAYCWSRSQGNSVMESVNEAKNVTVNFNVKGGGRLAASCRAVYSFFNAALQGIGRMARLAKENPKAFAACLTACMLQGAVLPWLNMLMFGLLGGDDDDWKKYEMLTEYTANKNLVLYVGNHKFLKIPYSQELAPFAAMGNIFFRQQMGWNKGESVASQVGKMFLDLAPVSIGESKTFMGKAIKTATPTALMPFVELWMNEDFTGSPIQKDNQWNKYARGWERAYEGKTSKWLVDASKWLDDKTGIDISPAVAEHMFSGVLGGIGRSGDKLLRYFSNGFQLQDAPFIRTLMFDSKQQGYVGAVQREYGRNAYDVLDKVKHDVENMDAMEFARFSQTEEFEIANLVSIYKTGKDLAGNKTASVSIDKLDKQLKKAKKENDGSDASEEMIEALQAEITEAKMEMLDEIEQIKYEHSGEVTLDNLFGLRKRIIERVNEVERESKEKYKREHPDEE